MRAKPGPALVRQMHDQDESWHALASSGQFNGQGDHHMQPPEPLQTKSRIIRFMFAQVMAYEGPKSELALKRINQLGAGARKVSDVACDHGHTVLRCGGGNHCVSLRFWVRHMQAGANRGRVLGERQYPSRKAGFYTAQPTAQGTALRRCPTLQSQDTFFEFKDGDGRHEQVAGGLVRRPSAYFG